jgi:hypothetical protein
MICAVVKELLLLRELGVVGTVPSAVELGKVASCECKNGETRRGRLRKWELETRQATVALREAFPRFEIYWFTREGDTRRDREPSVIPPLSVQSPGAHSLLIYL